MANAWLFGLSVGAVKNGDQPSPHFAARCTARSLPPPIQISIGCAGLVPLEDWRGRPDSVGRELHATAIAIADEAASAADLVRAKDSREPAVRIRGLERHISPDNGPGISALAAASLLMSPSFPFFERDLPR